MMPRLLHLIAILAFLPGVVSLLAAADEPANEISEGESFWSQFRDPDDGMIDMSQWLLENIVGFMPVPVIITEPAVDDGIGLAGLFFHDPGDDQMQAGDDGDLILPNISAFGAAYTGNESWFVGGGHFRNWNKDRFRYNIIAGYADINLDWYGGSGFSVPSDGIRFNAKGAMLDQEFLFRLGKSDWFLGGSWRYLESDVTFKTNLPIELPSVENSVSGLSAVALFEDLDFQMSPRNGFTAKLGAATNKEALGSDFDFEEYSWEVRQYFEFAEKYTLSWRLDGASVSGGAPFYLLPFVSIQGIPALRYQGETAATFEVRGGYDLHPRWTVLGFTGGGRAADSISKLASATTRTAYGAGFRYLIASAVGMRVGIDVARGPEGTHGYLVIGSAW